MFLSPQTQCLRAFFRPAAEAALGSRTKTADNRALFKGQA